MMIKMKLLMHHAHIYDQIFGECVKQYNHVRIILHNNNVNKTLEQNVVKLMRRVIYLSNWSNT